MCGLKLHICINCGTEIESINDLSEGCPKCGSKFFRLVKPKESSEEKTYKESLKSLEEIDDEDISESIESILVKQQGIYELDLEQLLNTDELVYADTNGNYAIDIDYLFKKNRNKKK